jgi:AhpD family alkylhydroperoxidase
LRRAYRGEAFYRPGAVLAYREQGDRDRRPAGEVNDMTQRSDYQTHAAAGMRALGGAHLYISKSGLPKTLIDLVYLRTSQINGCAYCIDMHTRDLQKEGVPVEKLMLLSAWREAGGYFSERERAALAWTEALTRISETRAPDADYEWLSSQFTERERVDLTLAINAINSWNRLAIGFRSVSATTGAEPS